MNGRLNTLVQHRNVLNALQKKSYSSQKSMYVQICIFSVVLFI